MTFMHNEMKIVLHCRGFDSDSGLNSVFLVASPAIGPLPFASYNLAIWNWACWLAAVEY